MFDLERGSVIDVEATFVRVEAAGKHVRQAAQRLVEEVLRQRRDWAAAWRDVIINPKGPSIENFPPETPGCSPGSCQMKVGNRVVAKFIVRFCDESCAVEVEADMPARKLAGWGVGMERQATRYAEGIE